VNISDLYALFQKVRVQTFFLAVLLYLIGQIFFVARWEAILHTLAIQISWSRLTSLHFLSLFFSFFLPTSIGGDFVRAFYLSGDTKRKGASFLSVFIDRYVALFGLILTATVAALVSQIAVNQFLLYPWLVGLSLVVFFVNFAFSQGYHKYGIRMLPPRFKSYEATIFQINESLQILFKNKKTLYITLLLTAAFLVVSTGVHQLLIQDMGKVAEFKQLLVFIPLIALAASVPVSIGGIGLRESAYVYLFSNIGFTSTESLTLASFIFVIWLITSLPGVVAYFLNGQISRNTEVLEARSSQYFDF
jgi:hypothetical protein